MLRVIQTLNELSVLTSAFSEIYTGEAHPINCDSGSVTSAADEEDTMRG